MDLVYTDVMIDVQRGHAPVLSWFAGLADLPAVPGLVVMELVDEMARYLDAAGFQVEEIIERPPYPDVEHQSRRAYIFELKPS